MTDAELLILALVAYSCLVTWLWAEAKREIRIAKRIMITLVQDRAERERFFTGFEKVLEGKLNDQ